MDVIQLLLLQLQFISISNSKVFIWHKHNGIETQKHTTNQKKEKIWVYRCENNQMLKCSSTYIYMKSSTTIISESSIRNEHKKMIGDCKELWTFPV